MLATLRFDNVSSDAFRTHEAAFVTAVATELEAEPSLLRVDTVEQRPGLTGAHCARITVAGLAEGSAQADRMGDYYHTRQSYADHPVFFSAKTSNYIYYYPSKSWWLIGPTLGSEYASLLVASDALSPLDIAPDASWFKSAATGWERAQSLVFGCNPAPNVDVTFRVLLPDCHPDSVAAGKTYGDVIRRQAVPLMAPLRSSGLLTTAVGFVRSHLQSCAPKIELEMPKVVGSWDLKTTCRYNGHHLIIHHNKPESHSAFACSHKFDTFKKKWDCACHSWPNAQSAPTPSPTPAPPTPAPPTPPPTKKIATTTTTTTTTTPAPTSDAQATAAQIDINVATAAELQALYGVDATKAAAIVAYRRAHGSFVDTGMLENVEGMTLADVANVANNAGAAYGHAIVTDAKAQTDAPTLAPLPATTSTAAPTAYGDWVFRDWWSMDSAPAAANPNAPTVVQHSHLEPAMDHFNWLSNPAPVGDATHSTHVQQNWN